MVDSRVGRRYAQALYTTAAKYDTVTAVESDLDAIAGLLANDRQFRQFILAPHTSREEKLGIAERVFGDRVTAVTMQLLRVMLEKGRESELGVVHAEFVRLRREHMRVVSAVVTSSVALDEAQRKAIEARLQTQLGKTIEATYEVDPRLMGGVKVAYGNYVLDGTVRGALNRLRDTLRHDVLKQA